MTATRGDDALMQVLRKTILALVRRDEADLTSRQFGVFLTVYLTAGPHTVRGLAAELNASKPAITRALDRLGELSLARRKVPNGSPQRACAADSRGECVPGRPAPRHGGGGHGASHRGGVTTGGAAPGMRNAADCSATSRHEAGSVLVRPSGRQRHRQAGREGQGPRACRNACRPALSRRVAVNVAPLGLSDGW
jgi:hypothetical protein